MRWLTQSWLSAGLRGAAGRGDLPGPFGRSRSRSRSATRDAKGRFAPPSRRTARPGCASAMSSRRRSPGGCCASGSKRATRWRRTGVSRPSCPPCRSLLDPRTRRELRSGWAPPRPPSRRRTSGGSEPRRRPLQAQADVQRVRDPAAERLRRGPAARARGAQPSLRRARPAGGASCASMPPDTSSSRRARCCAATTSRDAGRRLGDHRAGERAASCAWRRTARAVVPAGSPLVEIGDPTISR